MHEGRGGVVACTSTTTSVRIALSSSFIMALHSTFSPTGAGRSPWAERGCRSTDDDDAQGERARGGKLEEGERKTSGGNTHTHRHTLHPSLDPKLSTLDPQPSTLLTRERGLSSAPNPEREAHATREHDGGRSGREKRESEREGGREGGRGREREG